MTTPTIELQQAIEFIETAVDVTGFAMKLEKRDQLNGEYTANEGTYIEGAAFLYNIPRGMINHSINTRCRFACANVYFMTKFMSVPIIKTNIPEICNIPRSDGRVHRGRIVQNQSVFLKKAYNKLAVSVAFNTNETQKIIPKTVTKYYHSATKPTSIESSITDEYKSMEELNEWLYQKDDIYSWGDLQKIVFLEDFMKVNEVKVLEIYLYSINIDDYPKENDIETQQAFINYYNNELQKWIYKSLIIQLTKEQIPTIIKLDNKVVFTYNTDI